MLKALQVVSVHSLAAKVVLPADSVDSLVAPTPQPRTSVNLTNSLAV